MATFDTSDFSLATFDFRNENKVSLALALLKDGAALKFVEKMKLANKKAFFYFLHTHDRVRSLVLKKPDLLAPAGLLADLEVKRKILNNPRLQLTSTMRFGICKFDAEAIANFIVQKCNSQFGQDGFAGNVKIFVIVEGYFRSKEVLHALKPFGYTFFTTGAPASRARSLIFHQDTWPTFLVTPEFFSGEICGRVDAAFVFMKKHELEDFMALERSLALEHCSTSFAVFPDTDNGLVNLADHYADVNSCQPFRI